MSSLIVNSHTNNTPSEYIDRPRSELTELELQKLEEFEFTHGPMSLLQNAVNNNTPIVISCRNNHKLIAKVRAFDRHCNLVLENVKELWTETVKNNKGKKIKTNSKERFVSKMFLRGDSVIIIVKA
ncbi:Small nuclear ribonucleoprotein Sm D2 [Spathaspora sp. JA1]|nr:Small nuclear ribonucleoprotein Sm D2 [Spathaspora sp. JA1]